MRFRPLALLGLLLTTAAAAVAGGVAQAGDGRLVGVGTVVLPGRKDGGRDLRYALGARAEAAAAVALAAGLRGTSLVTVADDGQAPDLVLQLTIEKARTRPLDRSDVGGRTSLVELEASVAWEWVRDGRAVHSGRLERQTLEEYPGRIDPGELTLAWEELLAEIGREAVLEAGAAGVFAREEAAPLPERPARDAPEGASQSTDPHGLGSVGRPPRGGRPGEGMQ